MVARLKFKGIDGRAPPGVEPAAQFDSTREHLPGSDVASGCLFLLESYLLSSPHDVAQVQHIPIVCMPL